jgi:hypothetical protein
MFDRFRKSKKPIQDWQIFAVGTVGVALVGLIWGNPEAILAWGGLSVLLAVLTFIYYVKRTAIEMLVKKYAAPMTFEVLGTNANEKGIQWFVKHFGHRSVDAMSISNYAIGFVAGIVLATLLFSSIVDGLGFALGWAVILGAWLLILKHDSKKVAQ